MGEWVLAEDDKPRAYRIIEHKEKKIDNLHPEHRGDSSKDVISVQYVLKRLLVNQQDLTLTQLFF